MSVDSVLPCAPEFVNTLHFLHGNRWTKWCRCMKQWWPDTLLWLLGQQVEENQLWSARCVKLRPSQCPASTPWLYLFRLCKDRSSICFYFPLRLKLQTKMFPLNPKAMSVIELYGVLDPDTRDWTDGILSNIFRDINKPTDKQERR